MIHPRRFGARGTVKGKAESGRQSEIGWQAPRSRLAMDFAMIQPML
jgi:hypothetical protein